MRYALGGGGGGSGVIAEKGVFLIGGLRRGDRACFATGLGT